MTRPAPVCWFCEKPIKSGYRIAMSRTTGHGSDAEIHRLASMHEACWSALETTWQTVKEAQREMVTS